MMINTNALWMVLVFLSLEISFQDIFVSCYKILTYIFFCLIAVSILYFLNIWYVFIFCAAHVEPFLVNVSKPDMVMKNIMFWTILFGIIPKSEAVVCSTCFGQITGCLGGATCAFLTTTAANLLTLTVAGGAAITVALILPHGYLRFLPTQVLRQLTAIARRPNTEGAPDLSPMTLAQVMETYDQALIDISVFRSELNNRLADVNTSAAMVTRISGMLAATSAVTSAVVNPISNGIEGILTVGPLSFIAAVASLIVSGRARQQLGAIVPSVSAQIKLKKPDTASEFYELLMVWQTLCHATSAANILATAGFLQDVVHDPISTLGIDWQNAYCLFLVYLEAIENSRKVLHLGNVFASGSQDTRRLAALQRKNCIYPVITTMVHQPLFSAKVLPSSSSGLSSSGSASLGVPPKDVWNGKFSANSPNHCLTFNHNHAVHPKKHLFKDGTCKFRHVCMQWVTDKGPKGTCDGDHGMYACTNPAFSKVPI